MSRLPVLIAGAGPTGLVLAIALARRGVRVRIVDAAAGPGEHSRAMVVQARTLEFYRAFGFADEVVAAGVRVESASIGNSASRPLLRFADIGRGLSRYPFPLAYPQDDHERLLVARLAAAGVTVERRCRLVDLQQDADGVDAVVEQADGGRETIRADHLCGADGAHSAVRHALGIAFDGGTYPQRYYVADVAVDGPPRRDLHASLGRDAFLLRLPVRSSGTQRLIGIVPPAVRDHDGLGWDDLRAAVEPLLDVRVGAVRWFASYRVHHRVAARFQNRRVFLLGDAGHVHSPAGGQGMNTGIGDAVNLGWKLAQVHAGRAPETLLDSYEAERIGFARQLVATTDRAFSALVSGGLTGLFVRRVLAPMLLPLGLRLAVTRRTLFRIVSQIEVAYPQSPLSAGSAGRVRGGDRLPYVEQPDGGDNHAPLASLDWQVHLYGGSEAQAASLATAGSALALPVHAFAWCDAAGRVGLRRGTMLLVRPDGYVALAAEDADGDALARYASRRGLHLQACDTLTRPLEGTG